MTTRSVSILDFLISSINGDDNESKLITFMLHNFSIKQPRVIIFGIGLVLALMVGGLGFYIGVQNNNQGEFYSPDTGVWNITYALMYVLAPLVYWSIIFSIGMDFLDCV